MVEFNLNSVIKVRLYMAGYKRLADEHNKFCTSIPNWESRTPEYYERQADHEGYTEFQAWDFISLFGSVTHLGMPSIYHTTIMIKEDDLQVVEVTKTDFKKWYQK